MVTDDDEASVMAANGAFYAAFETRDVRRMAEVWEQSDRVFCVHPGWINLIGWTNVISSFYTLFSNLERLQFIIVNEQVHCSGDVAWVFCDENMLDRGVAGETSAVNLFSRASGDAWMMIGHVATSVR